MIGKLEGKIEKRVGEKRVARKAKLLFYSRLGFSVFLNNAGTGNDLGGGYENNDYLPEACQINMDYTGMTTYQND